jgi:hypothetical protein
VLGPCSPRRGGRSPELAQVSAQLAGLVDGVEGLTEVLGKRVGGGDDVLAGLDLDGAVAAGSLDDFLIDQPVRASNHRLTARAANTIVRWASIESRLRW